MTSPLSPRDQGRHTRLVTELMMSSCGDLILNGRGNLCTRVTYADDIENGFKDLPWAEHRIGNKLATITRFGWHLTRYGAEYILENSIFEKRDQRYLEGVRNGLYEVNPASDRERGHDEARRFGYTAVDLNA